MSESDRRKWEARYRDGAYASRRRPSAFLASCADLLPQRGQALDLACGAGRNALFLAGRGLAVDAVDISRTALEQGRAQAGDLPTRWIEHDLDDGFVADRDYDLIVNIRYANLPLIETLLANLRPGGLLLVEQHLATDDANVAGPRNPAFRVPPGALAKLVGSLRVECHWEGFADDPDGRRAALARLAARKI